MKKMKMFNRHFVIVLLAAGIIFSGCSKEDDEEPGRQNTIEYKDTSYLTPLAFADVNESGTNQDGSAKYRASIELTNQRMGTYINASEKLHIFHIVISGLDEQKIPTGTFTKGTGSGLGYTWFQWDMNPLEPARAAEAWYDTGTVDIKQEGDIYTVTFELTTSAGNTATGYYQGRIVLE